MADWTRVAEIRSSARSAPVLLGSGYRITRSLVMTVGHVAHRTGVDRQYQVRFMDLPGSAVVNAELVWHSSGICPVCTDSCADSGEPLTGGLDLALLRLPPQQYGPAAARLDAARWGTLVTSEQRDVTAVCFPDVQRHGGASDSYGIQGTINPATAHHAFHYELKLSEPVGDHRDPWRGASGAAKIGSTVVDAGERVAVRGDRKDHVPLVNPQAGTGARREQLPSSVDRQSARSQDTALDLPSKESAPYPGRAGTSGGTRRRFGKRAAAGGFVVARALGGGRRETAQGDTAAAVAPAAAAVCRRSSQPLIQSAHQRGPVLNAVQAPRAGREAGDLRQ
ncbi:hypothetical protein SALBM135S_05626 [Streptomyces alboniger]